MTTVDFGLPAAPPRQVLVGQVPVGGSAPVSVQSMTTTPTCDVNATLQRWGAGARAGCGGRAVLSLIGLFSPSPRKMTSRPHTNGTGTQATDSHREPSAQVSRPAQGDHMLPAAPVERATTTVAKAVSAALATQRNDGTWCGAPSMYGPRPFLARFPARTHVFTIACLRDLLAHTPVNSASP